MQSPKSTSIWRTSSWVKDRKKTVVIEFIFVGGCRGLYFVDEDFLGTAENCFILKFTIQNIGNQHIMSTLPTSSRKIHHFSLAFRFVSGFFGGGLKLEVNKQNWKYLLTYGRRQKIIEQILKEV